MAVQVPLEISVQTYTVRCSKCHKTLMTGDHAACVAAIHEHMDRLDEEEKKNHNLYMVPVGQADVRGY